MPEGGPLVDFATITPPGEGPKITSIFQFSAEALEQLAFWLEQRGLHIPVTQILGFSQYTAQGARVDDLDTITGTTAYSDMAHDGPTLTGLSDGKYVFWYGAEAFTDTANRQANLSPSFNGSTPTDAMRATTQSLANSSISAAVTQTLSSGGNNTVKLQYQTSDAAATASFRYRWILALRYGN